MASSEHVRIDPRAGFAICPRASPLIPPINLSDPIRPKHQNILSLEDV